MRRQLENTCDQVDAILARHGLSTKVAGGFLSNGGMLLSLNDATFINTAVRRDIKTMLKVLVEATVGVILLSSQKQDDNIIEGECWPAVKVETVDMVDLISDYERGER